MSSTPIRILVVEDQYFFRIALRTTIDSRPDMRIVAETDKGSEALDLCRQHRPDVVIMDLRLPGISGFEAIELIHRELDLTMAFCGHTNIKTVDKGILLPGTYPTAGASPA